MLEPGCGVVLGDKPEGVAEGLLVIDTPFPIEVKVVQSDEDGMGWADGVIVSTTCLKVDVP